MPLSKTIIEAIGYLGSFLVVISMLMTSVNRLRIVNTVGSLIFTVYAFIIGSYPTAFMNMCIIGINLYQLYHLAIKDKNFKLLRVNAEDGTVQYLLELYEKDIKKFFPSAAIEASKDCDCVFMVTCDTACAGLLLGNETEEGEIRIIIDYATPAYRDTSVGKYLYARLPEHGIKRLIFSSKSQGHEDYMKKMGFIKTDKGFVKEL